MGFLNFGSGGASTKAAIVKLAAEAGMDHDKAREFAAQHDSVESAKAALEPPKAKAGDGGVSKERQRVREIRQAAMAVGLRDFGDELIDQGVGVEAARAQILERHAAMGDTHEYAPKGKETSRPADRLKTGLVAWMQDPRGEGALSPMAAAVQACEMNGLRAWDGVEAISMAHTTSDFKNALNGALGDQVARGVNQQMPALAEVSHHMNSQDYRSDDKLIDLSASSMPEAVLEGGEIKHVTISDNGEALPVPEDYAALFSLSNKALVNDSTAARVFGEISRRMTEGAVERLRATLLAPVEANGGAGNNLSDGNPVFHTSRGNIQSAPAGLNVTSLSEALQAMRKMRGRNGELLSVEPEYLVVPAELEVTARKLVGEIVPATADDVNVFSRRLQVIVEPGLSSATGFYLVASPARFDGLAHSFLTGFETPRIETREGWSKLGVEFRLWWPMDAKFVAAHSWYYDPGA